MVRFMLFRNVGSSSILFTDAGLSFLGFADLESNRVIMLRAGGAVPLVPPLMRCLTAEQMCLDFQSHKD